MLASGRILCRRCGRPAVAQAPACDLCGELLRRPPPIRPPSREELRRVAQLRRGRPIPTPVLAPPPVDHCAERRRLREGLLFLGLGLVSAPAFSITPLLGYMGWFFASLVHEMGHSAVAWLLGMPAVPAIALDGHAAAVHSDQQLFLVAMIVLTLATTAWTQLAGRRRGLALVGLGVLYPACAFTDARELLHLAGGHAGELAFATLALWKTLDGGFTHAPGERLLYGTMGWLLLGKNVTLAWGLASSAARRAGYAENGSFGLTNDYIRIAEDLLGWRLESVGWVALLASLAVLPVALGLWRLASRPR